MDEIFIHLPKHLIRYETGQAIDSLAQRFSLPNEPSMQDWPIEVADKQRLDEFLSAYSECNDDECFVLMIILLECIDSFGEQYYKHPSWSVIYDLLDTHITDISIQCGIGHVLTMRMKSWKMLFTSHRICVLY